jgi:hypothetical protein
MRFLLGLNNAWSLCVFFATAKYDTAMMARSDSPLK